MSQAHALWYFDFISPFAYLQWQRLRAPGSLIALEPRPILLAAVLTERGQKGPAEIPAKRVFTYQYVQWRAQAQGVTLRFPSAHPFNPIAALRLCVACGCSAESVTAIYEHIWREGLAADTAEALAPVAARLGIADTAVAIGAPEVKASLREYTEEALRHGVFGVPTVRLNGRLFFGDDATPMIEAYLDDPSLFDSEEMRRIADLPVAASRF